MLAVLKRIVASFPFPQAALIGIFALAHGAAGLGGG